jgi:hypothetical protein
MTRRSTTAASGQLHLFLRSLLSHVLFSSALRAALLAPSAARARSALLALFAVAKTSAYRFAASVFLPVFIS